MNPLRELIQACVEKICMEAGVEPKDILNKTTEQDVEYAEVLCRSVLDGFLEYGWNNGARFDTPAIRVALMYCLYLGMAMQNLARTGKTHSVEELLLLIDRAGGITEWTENTLEILHTDADFKSAAKFTALSDAYVNYSANGLPEKISSGEDAVLCVCACAGIYLIGKYELQPKFEK